MVLKQSVNGRPQLKLCTKHLALGNAFRHIFLMFLLIYGVFIFSMRDKEDYIDEELGWRIHVERVGRGVTYTYTNQKTGEVITGRALEEAYESPGCTPDITSQIRENDGLGKKTKSFPSDCSESKIEG